METRVGIKLTALILQNGLINAKGGLLESTTNANDEDRREEICKSCIKLLFNITILDKNVNKYQCNLPLEDNPKGTGRRIGIINFENTRVRKIIENLEHIIDS